MQIYNPDNTLLLDIDVDDSSLRFKDVMGENNLSLKFSINENIAFPAWSWCEFKGERYILFTPETFIKQHSEHYDYSLVFEAWIGYMKFVKFKFLVVERNPNQEDKIVGSPKLKFSLTATPEDFVRMLVDCMNFSGIKDWQVGECIESEPVTIDFNHDYCFGVLQKIADAFNSEWEVENKTIHIRKVEKQKDKTIKLSYGYENGILGGISRKQFDSSKVINRVLIQGGDRNIDYATYKNETLLLPKSKVISYEGVQYQTDESGSYIERVNRIGFLSEDSLDVSKIYPSRVGHVSSVIVVDDSKGFYDIVDTTIPEDLDYSQLIIAGEEMTIIFQTGDLAGQEEFSFRYYHSERRFVLVPKNNNGLLLPHGTLVPKPNDKYAVFHIKLPQEYIARAEDDALTEAVKYLADNEQPKYTYQWNLDGIYAKRQWGEIGDRLAIGHFVEFFDEQFLPEPVNIRIVSVKDYVNKPQSPTIEISNNVTGKSLPSVLAEIPMQEQATDRKAQQIMGRVSRTSQNLKELEYLKVALENRTEIDGGLLLTTIIKLGAILGDEWIEKAGINGAATADNDVIAYFGGTLVDAINNIASIIFRMDGSGQLAKGNIKWDKDGNPVFNGVTTSTDADGNVVTMDASKKRITLTNKFGDVMGVWSYASPADPTSDYFYSSQIEINRYSREFGEAVLLNKTILTPLGVEIRRYTSDTEYQETSFGNGLSIFPNSISAENMPIDSKFGLGNLRFWIDGEFVKVVRD